MPIKLTTEQIDQYREQGYLILRASEHNLFSDPTILQQWANEVKNWPLQRGKWMPYFEINDCGEKQIMRTEKFLDYHEEFRSLLCGDGLRGILAQCSGEVGLESFLIHSSPL